MFVIRTDGPGIGVSTGVYDDPTSFLLETMDRMGLKDTITVSLQHTHDWGAWDYTFNPAGTRRCKDERCGELQHD